MRTIFLLVILVAGCATSSTARFVPTNATWQPLPPKNPNNVVIASTPPTRPFFEVGFVEGSEGDDDGSMLATMRAMAAQRGCDVLLVTGSNNTVSGTRGWTSTSMGYHSACLVYGEPPPPPSPPAPPAPAAATLLFQNDEGTLFRVQLDARDAALKAGWVQVH